MTIAQKILKIARESSKENPEFTIPLGKYAKKLKCVQQSLSRVLKGLVEAGDLVLVRQGGWRDGGTVYRLPSLPSKAEK